MPTWVYRPNHPDANENGMVDRSIAGERPRNGAPHVISDSLGKGLLHHGTGKMTDSKSHFRRMTRDSGCVEIGNEKPKAEPMKVRNAGNIKNDIGRAIYELKNGRTV